MPLKETQAFGSAPIERRKTQRVPAVFKINFMDDSEGTTVDMSEEGARIASSKPLESGRSFIRLLLPSKSMTLAIDSVWSSEDTAMGLIYGVKFLNLSEEDMLFIRETLENKPVIEGHEPPSKIKRFFYNALSLQWNPEKEIDWNAPLGLDDSLCKAMVNILSPIIIGEYSAFDGIPPRILSFKNYEVKQYLAAQLVDETRHAEAFDLYLSRIHGRKQYKSNFRNVFTLRFFNELKKLDDLDEWVAGLYLTEIMSHVLLSAYAQKVRCPLTQRLFKLILSDEARHISFASFYLKEVLKRASPEDRKHLAEIPTRVLKLTEGMVHSYGESAKAFGLDPGKLFDKIKEEFNVYFIQNLVREKNDLII